MKSLVEEEIAVVGEMTLLNDGGDGGGGGKPPLLLLSFLLNPILSFRNASSPFCILKSVPGGGVRG